uniref:Uncharacterized protein n=1 Tax=Glossina pallidipes TaxID=7398 RepID=A0A1A9ZRZ9_GLOPL
MIRSHSCTCKPWDTPVLPQRGQNMEFEKPSRRSDICYPDFAKEAAVGYVNGDSTCGQRALYEVGITAIPVYNVDNNKKIIK